MLRRGRPARRSHGRAGRPGRASDRYDLISAGVDTIVASIEGQELDELDEDVLGQAFAENWDLDVRYPVELPGRAFCRRWTQLVFVTIVLTLQRQRQRQRQLVAGQGLEAALEAAAAWPSDLRVGSFARLADYEPACRRETEERLREGGLPTLWKLAEEQPGGTDGRRSCLSDRTVSHVVSRRWPAVPSRWELPWSGA